MKKLSVLLIVLTMLTAYACHKEEIILNEDPEGIPTEGYITLKVGSYWIYQHYMVMDNGTETTIATVDSAYISGTKEINGHTYYISGMNGKINLDLFLRDSMGYLVDDFGRIYMSETNFTDTIYSNSFILQSGFAINHTSIKMYDNQENISVPAASFSNCIEARTRIKLYSPSAADPKLYYDHAYYAQGVGLVQSSYRYIFKATVYRKKLIRYYIPN